MSRDSEDQLLVAGCLASYRLQGWKRCFGTLRWHAALARCVAGSRRGQKRPTVFAEYYKRPEATAESFTADGWSAFRGRWGRWAAAACRSLLPRPKEEMHFVHYGIDNFLAKYFDMP